MSEASEHPTIVAAMIAASVELDLVPKDRQAKAGSFSYSYANLGDVLKHVRPILASHGLLVVQDIRHVDGMIAVTTSIHHNVTSDEWQFGPLCATSSDPQSNGSAITYLRRYAVLAALGLATSDDDGALASSASTSAPRMSAPRPVETDPGPLRLVEVSSVSAARAALLEAMNRATSQTRNDLKRAFADEFGKPSELEESLLPLALQWLIDRERLIIDDASYIDGAFLSVES